VVVASGIASRHWSGMDDSCHSVHAIRLACCMRCHWLGMGDSRQVRHGAVDMRICVREGHSIASSTKSHAMDHGMFWVRIRWCVIFRA